MHWYTKKFLRLNQVQLDEGMILCCQCEEYLGTTIWITQDGRNMCNNCKESLKCFTDSRNHALELVLKEFQYPCFSPYECHFTSSYEEMKQHSNTCQPAFHCTFCDSTVDIDHTIEHYLEQHCRQKLFASHEGSFNKIALILPFRTDEMHRIHILRSGYTNFILFIVAAADGTCTIAIAKHESFQCPIFNRATQDYFAVEWHNKATKELLTYNSETCSIRTYFAGQSQLIAIPASALGNRKQRVELKITFNGYKTVEPETPPELTISEKCSFCTGLETMLFGDTSVNMKIFSACEDCKDITKRDQISQLKKVRCQNTHCLKVMPKSLFNEHEARCAFADTECPDCDDLLPRMKLIEHMGASHRRFFQPYEFYIHPKVATKHHYLLFDGCMFQLTVTVWGGSAEGAVGFTVRLLLEEVTPAHHFRYELHFYDKPSAIIAKLQLGNACQTSGDATASTCLQTEMIPRVQGDEMSLGFFRIYIFHAQPFEEESFDETVENLFKKTPKWLPLK